MPFKFTPTQLPEIILIEPKVFEDGRGYLLESYKQSEFKKNNISEKFVQDNHSQSTKGVLRGFHYQINPYAQGKLIRCIRGEIWDVVVNIRRSSPNYLQWVGETLSEFNKKMLYIPVGFAHGFVTLSDIAEIAYKTTEEYNPNYEKGIRWDDPDIGINWPEIDLHLSDRDLQLPFLNNAEVFE
jgi:dTDP-4-dehydrorhamnose 3,5-epimerase